MKRLRASLVAAWLLSLGCGARAADAGIRWQTDHASVAMGEPVSVTLTRSLSGAGPSLQAIDLKPLERDFEIRGRTYGSSADEEDLRLELYPLHYGNLPLPLPGSGAGPRSIAVTHGSDSAPDVQVRSYAQPAQWTERQPARLVIEACDDGTLLWQRPRLPSPAGLSVAALGEDQEKAGGCTLHRWSWAVTPTLPGSLHIAPGMLEASRFGRLLRFPAPAVATGVSAMPAWLPAGIPVGRPAVTTDAHPTRAEVGQPWEWRWQITAPYDARTLRAVLRDALKDSPEWRHFPPDIRAMSQSGVLPVWEVRLYALPARAGALPLPAVRLPWFDPTSRQLQQLAAGGGTIRVSDPAHARLLRIGRFVVALLLAAGLSALLRPPLLRYWQRRRTVRAILRSRDPLALQQAMFDTLCGRRTPVDFEILLRELQAEWKLPEIDGWLADFQGLRFGPPERASPGEFARLRAALAGLIAGKPH